MTATGSTKIMYIPAQSVNPTVTPAQLDRSDELRALDDTVTQTVSEYDTVLEIAARLTPDVTGSFMCDIFGLPTSTSGNGVILDGDGIGVPTGVTRHVWTVPVAQLATIMGVVGYKDQGLFLSYRGGACNKLDLSVSDTDGTLIKGTYNVNWLGQIADPAYTPAVEALSVLPFKRQNITLTWLGGSAAADDFTVSLGNPVDQFASLGSGSKWPDQLLKGDGPITATGTMSKRQIGVTDYNALIAGTPFAWKMKWASDSIATGAYKHQFWLSGPQAQYISGDGPNPLTAARHIGGDFNWYASSDGTNPSVTVTLANLTASYA